MNRDNIIKLAQLMMTDQHTRQYADPLYCFNETDIVHFIHAVQAVEREECAKVCDELGNATKLIYRGQAANDCAAAIRSRSNTGQ